MDRYTDEQILDGILNSDGKVFDFIYRQYYGKVESFLIGKGGNPEHVKDVFQEAMFVVYKKVQSEGLTLRCTFSTYLFAVCKNIWMHDLRKNRYQSIEDSSLANLSEDPEPDNEMLEKFMNLFKRHFAELSKDCQKLLKLHFSRVSLAEIQRIFGYSSEHYTSDRKYRCKQSLYKRIKNDPEYKKILKDG
jgi:RNA polymerase sigma factor (sigma-70 family)